MEQAEKKQVKTAIYCRVSTEEQVREGYSIDAQKYKLTQYCILREWDITCLYVDEGISGKNLKDRPQAMKMIEDVKKGLINNILVYKVDRLTRNMRDLLDLLDIVERYNVNFYSLQEGMDTSNKFSIFGIKLSGLVAEEERKTITERFQFGKEQKVRQGYYNIGPRPYGYEYDKETKALKIIESEANIVRYMFELALKGKGYCHIFKQLNDRRVPTRTGKGQWARATVMRMLKSPLYTGKVSYTIKNKRQFSVDSQGVVPPIIDEETFGQVQRILESRSMHVTRKISADIFIFGNVLYCGRCGWKMRSHTTLRYPDDKTSAKRWRSYGYMCKRSYSFNAPDKRCSQQMLSQPKLEKEFLRYLDELHLQVTNIDLSGNDEKKVHNQLNSLRNELTKMNERKRKLQVKYIDDKITEDEYLALLKEINDSIDSIENQIKESEERINSAENQRLNNQQVEEMIKVIEELKKMWPNMTNAEKKMFITIHFKKIFLDGPKIKKIDWYT